MPLSDYLAPAGIITGMQAASKHEALEELVNKLETACPGIDRGRAVEVLLHRESLGSTGIGEGVAIPHGKVEGCDNITVVIGRSVNGCDFDAVDRRKCHVFCLLVAPPKAAAMHLSVLAHFARIVKNAEFRSRFMQAQHEDDIWRLFATAWRD